MHYCFGTKGNRPNHLYEQNSPSNVNKHLLPSVHEVLKQKKKREAPRDVHWLFALRIKLRRTNGTGILKLSEQFLVLTGTTQTDWQRLDLDTHSMHGSVAAN